MSDPSRNSRLIPYENGLPSAFPGGENDPMHGGEPGTDPLEEAYQRGFQDGVQKGREEALAQMEAELSQGHGEIQEALKRIASVEETVLREYESDLLDVALTAASRIVRERIDQSDPVAVRTIQEALASLPERTRFKIRLNAQDMKAATASLEKEIAEKRIELVEDNTISRGGCMLETSAGSIDATLETAERVVRDSATGEAEHS